MMLLGILTRPWMLYMRSINSIPRVLADDFGIMAVGPDHLQIFIQAQDEEGKVLYAN